MRNPCRLNPARLGLSLVVAGLALVPPPEFARAAAAASGAHGVAVPETLSAADRERYRRIFALQEKGDWQAADLRIRNLEDRVLMGHVLAQRYLHPTKYRSKFGELAAWMKAHADLPDAKRIYRLAIRRKPRDRRAPPKPAGPPAATGGVPNIIEYSGYRPRRVSERRALTQVRRLVRRDNLTKAGRWIDRRDVRRILGTQGYHLARTRIASGWFFYGNAERAFAIAHDAAWKSRGQLPYSHWIAGLAAFRLGRHEPALRHFAEVARNPDLSRWDRAAGAFWAARAALRSGKPEDNRAFLRAAVAEPRTFYGKLARHWLGEESPFDWDGPPLTGSRLTLVAALPAVKRALALVEAGRREAADRELRLIVADDDPDRTEALLALAERLSLPATAFYAGIALEPYPDRASVAALYPVPLWKPAPGFKIDRALIYALIRQESAFNPRAVSWAGARGLMQLMPATAGFVAGKRFRGVRRNVLYRPEFNITLGQKYVLHLLADKAIDGDLLLLAAAYNGGPGNLKKWQRRMARATVGDPLMFIESIPSRETRIFVERVLSNLWMYRERLGEPAPTLETLAQGEYPTFVASDGFWKAEPAGARN